MSDFHQSGVITTFHNLRTQSIEQQEQEVRKFTKQSPVSLVLPSLYSELQGDALPRIVQILSEMDYINQIIIGLDRASLDEYKHALDFFSGLPQNVSLLWNDGERMKKIDDELKKYETTFEKNFLKSFTSRLTDYSDPKINVLSSEVVNNKYTIVKTMLLKTDKKPEVKIDWRVYTKNPENPLIRDLIIEGLSLARTQKEEFSSILNSNDGDINALFKTLEEFSKN